ncbi:MAG TPA: hypothetical protein VGM53_19680 [Streptosporangiaceae bacterium]|jgi:hypothetical protein
MTDSRGRPPSATTHSGQSAHAELLEAIAAALDVPAAELPGRAAMVRVFAQQAAREPGAGGVRLLAGMLAQAAS